MIEFFRPIDLLYCGLSIGLASGFLAYLVGYFTALSRWTGLISKGRGK